MEFGGDVASHVQCSAALRQFGELGDRHDQSLRDDAAQFDGLDAESLAQDASALGDELAQTALAKEGVAFVVGREIRVDLKVDCEIAGVELPFRGDDTPTLPLHLNDLQTIGVRDGGHCRNADYGCQFSCHAYNHSHCGGACQCQD